MYYLIWAASFLCCIKRTVEEGGCPLTNNKRVFRSHAASIWIKQGFDKTKKQLSYTMWVYQICHSHLEVMMTAKANFPLKIFCTWNNWACRRRIASLISANWIGEELMSLDSGATSIEVAPWIQAASSRKCKNTKSALDLQACNNEYIIHTCLVVL